MHGGADLDFLITKAADGLDGELKGILHEIQHNRHEWWIPGKVRRDPPPRRTLPSPDP